MQNTKNNNMDYENDGDIRESEINYEESTDENKEPCLEDSALDLALITNTA